MWVKWLLVTNCVIGLLQHDVKSNSAFSTSKTILKSYHPFFISVTEVQHNSKAQTLEITTKIFTDDFEKTLRQNYKSAVDLVNVKDKAAMEFLIADYVRKHLQITVDGKLTQLTFIGFERDEAVYCYFEAKGINTFSRINITNNLLYEYKKEQVNLVHVTANGKRQSSKLENPKSQLDFSF